MIHLISEIKITPVIGARTIAVKYPTIYKIMKLLKNSAGIPKYFIDTAPIIAPIHHQLLVMGRRFHQELLN